jgi:LAO/AO transport system kinase
MSTPATLSDRLLARDPRALARAISLVENETADGAALVGKIYAKTGRAHLIGVTGPPGAGKSTLVDKIVAEYRANGKTVAVLAVDPTSPYTGGAILGDRVRMGSHAQDEGVFIRSMATRGHLGGLATTTAEAALLLDAAGFDIVIIETVGVGQDEVDIVRTADVSIVVLVPGTGDEVQALKAGIMEIADIFVVNKADREGADRTASSIEAMLTLENWNPEEWRPPVLRTEATAGRGVAELLDMVAKFEIHAGARVGARRKARAEWRLREILTRTFMRQLESRLAPGEFDRTLDRIANREVDPYSAAESMIAPDVVLDHLGIAVTDSTAMQKFFREHFGLATTELEDVGLHRLRFVQSGDATLELVEPLSDEAPIAKFIAKRGEGLHHVCLRVKDIEKTMAALKAGGVEFIDERPRQGAHGSRIAFIKPASANGLLVEIKEVEIRHP